MSSYQATGACQSRSSKAAAWFTDHIEHEGNDGMQSLVLEGGIKAWAAEKGEFWRYMQEYDKSKWE